LSKSGYLALVLHAHLPFVRHPENDRHLEEQWLFEAVTETYLPLVQMLEAWDRGGVRPRLALSVSPTLSAMLQDPLLRRRCLRHLDGLIELAESEEFRNYFDAPRRALAERYLRRFRSLRDTYARYDGNLNTAWAAYAQRGYLELMTCSATHAVLPLLAGDPASLRAQLAVAREAHRDQFGNEPAGLWLPECAYAPEIEETICAAGFRWFILEGQGLLNALPRPAHGLFAPVLTPRGLAVFGRDQASARRVWSREAGYPGDPRYRDFYRDIAFDLDLEYLRPFLPAAPQRTFTGFKYHSITGATAHKALYDPRAALALASGHAQHFYDTLVSQVTRVAVRMDRPPIVVAPFDAELFGHWWFEGIEFLDRLLRHAARPDSSLELLTPSDYLRRHAVDPVVLPAASSWGEGGYWRTWLNEKNGWVQPPLRTAQARMRELAVEFHRQPGWTQRVLRQAGRELLLAQSSDWLFMIDKGTSVAYAERRLREHLGQFDLLCGLLRKDRPDPDWLNRLESKNNLFPQLDCGHWAT
jgi:1,4-alpha-glucan branching enzyme